MKNLFIPGIGLFLILTTSCLAEGEPILLEMKEDISKETVILYTGTGIAIGGILGQLLYFDNTFGGKPFNNSVWTSVTYIAAGSALGAMGFYPFQKVLKEPWERAFFTLAHGFVVGTLGTGIAAYAAQEKKEPDLISTLKYSAIGAGIGTITGCFIGYNLAYRF